MVGGWFDLAGARVRSLGNNPSLLVGFALGSSVSFAILPVDGMGIQV